MATQTAVILHVKLDCYYSTHIVQLRMPPPAGLGSPENGSIPNIFGHAVALTFELLAPNVNSLSST